MSRSLPISTVVPALVAALIIGAALPAAGRAETAPIQTQQGTPQTGVIAPYQPRFGRTRPVIAIVGENRGTELTDFAIPYGVLSRSGVADVLTVATQAGPLSMRPALTIQPDATAADFDRRFPEGADYVIVPAVTHPNDIALIAWIKAQARKGATVVSICDGALVVANTGLLNDHRATAHWATQGYRKKHYPEVKWQTNIRYVADGNVVSSAGVSASLPTALALVEAIAGHDVAAAEARELNVDDWSTKHNSESFRPRLGVNLLPLIAVNFTNGWFHRPETIGLPVSEDSDEIGLGFAADAWSRTGLGHAYSVAATRTPVRTRNGLVILPDLDVSEDTRTCGGP